MNDATVNKVTLDYWTEIVGQFIEIEDDGEFTTLVIEVNHNKTVKLEYARGSKESEELLRNLENLDRSTRIGILRTDLENKPLMVRVMDGDKS